MTVKQLIKELEKMDQDRIVVLSCDPEGNEYSKLHDIETGMYLPLGKYRGEIGLEELTPELIEVGYSEEDVISEKDGVKAVVLWPA